MTAIAANSRLGNDSIGNTGLPYDDLQGQITFGDAVANLTYEAFRDTPFKVHYFRHDQSDEIHQKYQTTHGWRTNTPLAFHLHLIPAADPVSTQNVRFAGKYAWAEVGVAVPADADWTTFTADLAVAPGDVNKPTIVSVFSATPPATAKESTILLVYLYRDSGAADTYTTNKGYGTTAANLVLLYPDCHYQKEKDGTASEIPA